MRSPRASATFAKPTGPMGDRHALVDDLIGLSESSSARRPGRGAPREVRSESLLRAGATCGALGDKGWKGCPSQRAQGGRSVGWVIPQLELNNGVTMPALGLGVFQTPAEETADAVNAALNTGYRNIDTAAAYQNERSVGEAVRSSGLPRDEVFVET